MSYCSTFSLRNSKVHQFLTTLERELSKYTNDQLKKISQAEPDLVQRKKIELMFKVEQRRFEEMKNFQAKNNISVLDKDSNKIPSTDSPDYQPIFKEILKNQNIPTQNKQRKASGFMQKQQQNGINKHKRFSVGLFGNSDNQIEIQIPLFKNNCNFSFKQGIFDIDEGSEDESYESKYSDEKEDQDSLKSQELDESFNSQDDEIDTFEQNAIAITIVKQRKVESIFGNDLPYVNILGLFKGKDKAVMCLDEDCYNYSVILTNNIIQDQKLLHKDKELYVNQLINSTEEKELFVNVQEDSKVLLFNDDIGYQYQMQKNLHIKKIKQEQQEKQYSFDFKDQHYIHKIHDSNFGSFINLETDKFEDNLIIERDMVFMLNQKHGFCVKEIVRSQNQLQIQNILNEKYENCDLLPLNINFDQAEQFYKKFLIPKARTFYTDKNIFEFNMKNFQMLINEYFRKYLVEKKQSFIIVGLLEYFKDYQFYKLTKNYIIFQVDLEFCNFYNNYKDTHTLIQGKNSQKKQIECQQEESKKIKEEFFKSFNQFHCSYQLNLGFNDELKIFYFTYQQKSVGANYYSIFAQDTSAMIKFQDKKDEKIKEGIWVGLFKFDIFKEFQTNQKGVILPYKSHLMFNKNVIHINDIKLKVIK